MEENPFLCVMIEQPVGSYANKLDKVKEIVYVNGLVADRYRHDSAFMGSQKYSKPGFLYNNCVFWPGGATNKTEAIPRDAPNTPGTHTVTSPKGEELEASAVYPIEVAARFAKAMVQHIVTRERKPDQFVEAHQLFEQHRAETQKRATKDYLQFVENRT